MTDTRFVDYLNECWQMPAQPSPHDPAPQPIPEPNYAARGILYAATFGIMFWTSAITGGCLTWWMWA